MRSSVPVNGSSFARALKRAADRCRVDGIICFQSSRLTALAELDAGPFVFGGCGGILADSWLYGLPCACLTDWLLDDEAAITDLSRQRLAPDSSDCAERLLNRIGGKRYLKLLRGPVASPWLAVVLVDPPKDARPCSQTIQRCATTLAMALLEQSPEAGREHRVSGGERVQGRRLGPLDLRAVLDVEWPAYHPPVAFEQYLRDLLGKVVNTVCPRNTLALVASVHVFCDRQYAEDARRRLAAQGQSRVARRDSFPRELIDCLVEIPTHEPAARKFIQDRKDVVLWGVHEFGLWKPDILRDYRLIPLDFAPGRRSSSKAPPTCFIRHAAMLGETHYFASIPEARQHEAARFPAVADLTNFTECQDACNLVIPLVDEDSGVSFGVINIESTRPEVKLAPDRIALADYLVRRFAASIREIRLHSIRRFIGEQRHRTVGLSARKDQITAVLHSTFERLGGLYRAAASVYEPRQGTFHCLASSTTAKRVPSLVSVCATLPHLVLLQYGDEPLLIPVGQPPYRKFGQPGADGDEDIALEVIPINDMISRTCPDDDLTVQLLEQVRAAGNAQLRNLGNLRERVSLLFVPLHLDYEYDRPHTRAAPAGQSFCAGVLVLRTERRWLDMLKRPGAARMLQPLWEFADLLRLAQRVRAQMIGMSTGALEHALPGNLLQGIQSIAADHLLHDAPEGTGYRCNVSYISLGAQYLTAMLREYIDTAPARPKPLETSLHELKELVEAVKALVHSSPAADPAYYGQWRHVDESHYPLWLAIRNWYSNSVRAASRVRSRGNKANAEIEATTGKGGFIVQISNTLDEHEIGKLSSELRLHPQGRPGKGRCIARELIDRHFSNVRVNSTQLGQLAPKQSYGVVVKISLLPKSANGRRR